MVERPTCVDCGASAPNTDTNYTLISATFGWRLSRRVLADGTRAVEWRCPNCWNAHKAAKPAAGAAHAPRAQQSSHPGEGTLAEAEGEKLRSDRRR
jgi:hypothetical protein